MPTKPFLLDTNGTEVNWGRVGIVAAMLGALMAAWTGLGLGQLAAEAMPWATETKVERVESQVERNQRVLRCLLRADPRQGPAIHQCDGDPLRGQ